MPRDRRRARRAPPPRTARPLQCWLGGAAQRGGQSVGGTNSEICGAYSLDKGTFLALFLR